MTVISEYIQGLEGLQLKQAKTMYQLLKKIVPKQSEESITYGLPTFKYLGNLVHFAVYKNHLGFYPAPSGIEAFQDQLKVYKTSKGAIQFPIEAALPKKLIEDIVRYRIQEQELNYEQKQAIKKVTKSVLKTCPQGHQFYKTADCNTCPKCLKNNKSSNGIFATLSNPARSALEAAGITTIKKLSQYTEKEILALHGIGKASLPILLQLLSDHNLSFKVAKMK